MFVFLVSVWLGGLVVVVELVGYCFGIGGFCVEFVGFFFSVVGGFGLGNWYGCFFWGLVVVVGF